MKKLFLVCGILLAGIVVNAQPMLTFHNNTTCNVWQDFYCSATNCAGPVVNTGGIVIGPGVTTYDATILNGGPLPAGHAWVRGRIGDDPSSCTYMPGGGGCSPSQFLTISNGFCSVGPPSGCYNSDASCSNCRSKVVTITTTFHPNGDLDVFIN